MTISEFVTKHLTDKGLWPDEATTVIVLMKERSGLEEDRRWRDDLSGYPEAFKAVLMITANSCALQYIDEQKPQHWARPMFLSESERQKLFEARS
jgi:hypothetical protein